MNLPSLTSNHQGLYFWKAGALRISNMILRGDYFATTWWLLDDHLVTTWWLLGNYLSTNWRPLGDHLATTAVHHLQCITSGVYVRGGKALKERENCFFFTLDFIHIFVYERGRKASKESENCFIFTLDFIHIFVYERGGKPLKERENCFIFTSNLINIWGRMFYWGKPYIEGYMFKIWWYIEYSQYPS